jgi:hypothetical protein
MIPYLLVIAYVFLVIFLQFFFLVPLCFALKGGELLFDKGDSWSYDKLLYTLGGVL